MTVTNARVLATGVLACGAVLLPVNAAFGNHMQMADGTMCPHAAGDISNPATSVAPSRAASERPLGSTPTAATPRSTPRPAVKPTVSQAPVQRAATTQSATTRAAKPAASTVKATATAKVSAKAARTQRVSAPVAQPKRVSAPVAKGSSERSAAKRTSARQATTPQITTTVIPDVTRPSAKSAPQLVARTTGAKPADATWIALGGLLTLLAAAVTVAVLRRRGSGGEEAVTADELSPLEPSTQVDEVEIALREMLTEARAAELLGQGGAAEAAGHDRELERL